MLKRKEKDFTILFGHWVKNRWKGGSAAFELKTTKTGRLPFSALQDHQRAALVAAKHGKLYHKIPDCGFQNPMDCFLLTRAEAYVVGHFIHPKNKKFYLIDIDKWMNTEKDFGGFDVKSLSEHDCEQIGIAYELGV